MPYENYIESPEISAQQFGYGPYGYGYNPYGYSPYGYGAYGGAYGAYGYPPGYGIGGFILPFLLGALLF